MRSEEEVIAIRNKLLYILKSKNESLFEKYGSDSLRFQPEHFPLDIRELYPGYVKYNLELGCGWGEFAREYCRLHPKEFYIATDKKRYRIQKSLAMQKFSPLGNLKWLVSNFSWFFEGLFLPHSFNSIIINFPDPWPKKRHQKHRFITLDLIKELHNLLAFDGNLEFATDHWDYMENAVYDFNKSGLFDNSNGFNVILPEISGRPVSFFENLKREEKENIYIIQLKKISAGKT